MRDETAATFYLAGMAHDDSMLQSYRSIFIGIEAILFGFALALWQLDIATVAYWLALPGTVGCVLWTLVCEHRGSEVWAWRDQLLSLTSGTDAGQFLETQWKGTGGLASLGFMHRVARIVFNWLFPMILFLGWVGFLLLA